MTDVTVRVLGVDDWQLYKKVRLAALDESPDAFVASYDAESAETEDFWRQRMVRSQRLLAERDGQALGVVSLGESDDGNPDTAQLFGLWVAPQARGTGVASALVRAGADAALSQGRTQLAYWVGTDNGRAVAFASGFGFRPGNLRRPMRVQNDADGEQELMMVLALGHDRGQPVANGGHLSV